MEKIQVTTPSLKRMTLFILFRFDPIYPAYAD